MCSSNLQCGDSEDQVKNDDRIGFTITTQKWGKKSCRELNGFSDYKLITTETGHDLTFVNENSCTENHYPRDLTTIFRLTCDWKAASRQPFTQVFSNEGCMRVFESTSVDACDLNYAGQINFNMGISPSEAIKKILVFGLCFLVFIVLPLYLFLF